jgi:hypothetical protein
VLFVQDEIGVGLDEDQAEGTAAWLRQGLVDGMRDILDPVPIEVEVKVASTWRSE